MWSIIQNKGHVFDYTGQGQQRHHAAEFIMTYRGLLQTSQGNSFDAWDVQSHKYTYKCLILQTNKQTDFITISQILS